MNLIITDVKGKNIDRFADWIIKQIQTYFIGSIKNSKLIKFDDYLQDFDWGFKDNKKHYISTKQIIIGAIYNLRYKKSQDTYTIEIDPNILIPNTIAKFIDIAKLVNYGNVSVSAYPIFTETFNYIADNFNFYIDEYSRSGE